jgi:hypothetical protein
VARRFRYLSQDRLQIRQGVCRQGIVISWLGDLDTYRTMCIVPEPPFRRVLETMVIWNSCPEPRRAVAGMPKPGPPMLSTARRW